MIILKSGRGGSNHCEINNVLEDKKIVIGDNHRFAPYFWAKLVGKSNLYELIRLDFHYDDNTTMINESIHSIPDPTTITFSDFICKKLKDVDHCAVSYDNIVSYFTTYNSSYKELIINSEAINKDSNLPFTEINRSAIESYLGEFNKAAQYCILDIDFDYFANSEWKLSDSEIEKIFVAINSNISSYDLITIALSPSTTKGEWVRVDQILGILNEVFSKQYSF